MPAGSLSEKLDTLSEVQKYLVGKFINQISKEVAVVKNEDSDIASDTLCDFFSAKLSLHHSMTEQPLTKVQFEYLLRDALTLAGHNASKSSNGKPGEDLIVDQSGWSCKTQADARIKKDKLHISKFMELGKGKWVDVGDMVKLRSQMFEHMKSYSRIFILRCVEHPGVVNKDYECFTYELVEIPKGLLLEANNKPIEIQQGSAQDPKPAYCHVSAPDGSNKFSLYFDGGTERKLQVKNIDKKLCKVHATWSIAK